MSRLSLFDLLTKNGDRIQESSDVVIPDNVEFVDNKTQEQFNSTLKDYNLEDLKLTARKRLILIDSFAELEIDEPSNEPQQYVQEVRCIDPIRSGTTSPIINGITIPSVTSGTSFNDNPQAPSLKTIPVVKRKKSDHAVVVSIKDQLKKKARRKLAAASKAKNRK